MGKLLSHNETIISDTVTSSGNSHSSGVITKWSKEAIFFLEITAASGSSPTLDITIEVYDDLTDAWYELATFDQKTSTTTDVGYIEYGLGEKVACSYTVGGSNPSFTFSLTVNLKDQM